jgi:signal peptide peptidase SppA
MNPYNKVLALSKTELNKLMKGISGEESGMTPVERPETMYVENMAIIPVKGIITKEISETELTCDPAWVAGEIQSAMANPEVDKIILDIDSPGGEVPCGIISLCDLIEVSRKEKPIYGITDNAIQSAAYWIASACTKIYSTKDAEIGSIGVFVVHANIEKQLEAKGVKIDVFSSGDLKGAGAMGTALSDKQKENMQKDVEYLFGLFAETVKRNRDVGEETLTGQSWLALQAIEIGLIDKLIPDFNSGIVEIYNLK